MKMHPLYPLTFRPIYKDTFWGGNAIAEHFNRPHTPRPCAESWELSALGDENSVVANGSFEGMRLHELVQVFGADLTGLKAPEPESFPLIFKLVDARMRCSVQVHPGAEIARELGARSKHEMWYVLQTYGEAELFAGVAPGPEQLEGIVNRLYRHKTHLGDVFDIPPGVVHALGGGNLIFEVQQSSATSYRIDDWGNGRQTHPEAAFRAIDWQAKPGIYPEPPVSSRDLRPRLSTEHFAFATLDLRRTRSLRTTKQSFMVLFCASGKATLGHSGPQPMTLLPGDLVLIPPQQYVMLSPLAEETRLLVTTL